MDQTNQILGVITILLLLIWMGPAALRMNIARGTTIRHLALWLAILIVLVFIYRFIPRY